MNLRHAVLLAGLFATSHAFAGADFCARLVKAPSVTLEMSKPVRQYRHDRNIDQLTELARGAGTPVSDGGMVTGLTSSDKMVMVKTAFSVAQVPDGFCVSPQAVVVVSDRHVTVDIAKDIPTNSCFFQATLEHEHKHVHVLEDVMTQTMQDEVASMQRQFRGQYGFYQDLRNAQRSLDEIKASVERRVVLAMDRVERQSAAIDTPDEYARVQSVCKNRPEPKKKEWWQFWG
ncbi:hypothetical protein QU487_06810 [Crenobacter sp. SG2305]|uniref:hypothetical protein n=1 Tax=Crenobacter oryzisoli TaxID=3056844 RepID=UPI0025AB01E7|nr:hypothetical protein [Crenobacter sp. SG2305]MDN0082465.1 hypothetical protein [Crenobacter sp. SG2305]